MNNPNGGHDHTSPYAELADVEAANAAAGQNWFSPATLAWWKCRIETGLIRGRYFITSEDPFDTGRRYSVRYAKDNGNIDSIDNPTPEDGKIGFASSAAAMDLILEHDQSQYEAVTNEVVGTIPTE